MDSFEQLIEFAHEARDSYKKFLEKNHDISIDQAFMNYHKSRQISEDIQNRMDKVEMKKEGSGYGYDNCVYYMTMDSLHRYEYSTLLVLTAKLGEAMKNMAEKTAKEEQKESLKTLIKEAVREMRQDGKLEKKPKIKRNITPK